MDYHSTAEAVTLYGHAACGQCKVSILALTKAGIAFQYRDTRLDPSAQKHVEDLGYTSVPVTEANGEHWHGFRPDRIKALAAATSVSSLQGLSDDPDAVMQLAVSRGYSEDLTDGERDDLLDEASWVLAEQTDHAAGVQPGAALTGLLQGTQQAS